MSLEFSSAAFPGAAVRATELEYIIDRIQHGQCCSVIGPSNIGKSSLLRSLPRSEVRAYCAQAGQPAPVVVFVDCLEAGGGEQAFYELLLRRTIEELEFAGNSSTMVDSLRQLYRQLLSNTTELAMRAIYATAVRQLGQEDLSLVLILDEFYDVFRHLPPWPFRQLRALFNALNGKVCYVTATSHHLEDLRPEPETYEFRELFHLHTLMLRPLPKNEAQIFAQYLASRQNITIHEDNIALLLKLSGGHPGILERIYLMVRQNQADVSQPLTLKISDLIRERPLHKECLRLWSELEAEQEPLMALIEQGASALDGQQRRLLEDKGLVISDTDQSIQLFSPVFARFIQHQFIDQDEVINQGLVCDFETGQIWVDDQEVTLLLSEPQRKLITYLFQKSGTVCTYDEIAEGVWGVGQGVSPGAIYELVKRVRQKIEPDWKNPIYIVTVPGKGYRLQQ